MFTISFSIHVYGVVCIPLYEFMLWALFKENLFFINQGWGIPVCKFMQLSFVIFISIRFFSIKELLYQLNSFLIFYKVNPFTNLGAIIIYTGFHVRESKEISRLYSSVNVTSSMYSTVSWNWFPSDLIKKGYFPVHSRNTWDLAKRNQNLTQSSENSSWVWKQECAHQP